MAESRAISPPEDLTWIPDPDQASLRRAVRLALRQAEPRLRIVAEGFLAAESAIDLLGVSEHGEFVSVRIAEPNEPARTLTALLSDLAWLDARAADLQRLAPELDLAPGAAPTGILLGRSFDAETRLALTQLPGRRVSMLRYQSYRLRSQIHVQLSREPVTPAESEPRDIAPAAPSEPAAPPPRAAPDDEFATNLVPSAAIDHATTDLAATTGFRTGLTDADLRLQSSEIPDPADEIPPMPDTRHR